LTLEICFLRSAEFFVTPACFTRLPFEAVACFALAPGLGFRLLTAPILLLMRACVEERAVARLALFGGQGG
jgi:hypothetical protein